MEYQLFQKYLLIERSFWFENWKSRKVDLSNSKWFLIVDEYDKKDCRYFQSLISEQAWTWLEVWSFLGKFKKTSLWTVWWSAHQKKRRMGGRPSGAGRQHLLQPLTSHQSRYKIFEFLLKLFTLTAMWCLVWTVAFVRRTDELGHPEAKEPFSSHPSTSSLAWPNVGK